MVRASREVRSQGGGAGWGVLAVGVVRWKGRRGVLIIAYTMSVLRR